MTEQLYKLEHRDRLETSSGIDIWDKYGLCYTLRPVPTPRTLAWALGEMYAHDSMRAYSRPGGTEIRWNSTKGRFDSYVLGRWTPGILIDEGDMTSTSWSLCEAESPDEEIPMVVNMELKPAIVPGSREWLLALPDETLVEEAWDTAEWCYVKRGTLLYPQKKSDASIRLDPIEIMKTEETLTWRLRAQSQAAPCGCGEIPDSKTDAAIAMLLDRLVRAEQRVERLEKLMEAKRCEP